MSHEAHFNDFYLAVPNLLSIVIFSSSSYYFPWLMKYSFAAGPGFSIYIVFVNNTIIFRY
mgnify:CR=1 FL=1